MKITREQIDALIDSIMEKRESKKKVNTVLLEKVDRIYNELSSLSKESKKYLRDACNIEISKKAIQLDIEVDIEDNSHEERQKLRNKILIASIDSNSIKELEQKLNIKI